MVFKGTLCSVMRKLRKFSGVRATVVENYESNYCGKVLWKDVRAVQ